MYNTDHLAPILQLLLLGSMILNDHKLYSTIVSVGNVCIVTKHHSTRVPLEAFNTSGPGCSKLTASLVNDSLKFQTSVSNIHQYFLLKKCEKLLH